MRCCFTPHSPLSFKLSLGCTCRSPKLGDRRMQSPQILSLPGNDILFLGGASPEHVQHVVPSMGPDLSFTPLWAGRESETPWLQKAPKPTVPGYSREKQRPGGAALSSQCFRSQSSVWLYTHTLSQIPSAVLEMLPVGSQSHLTAQRNTAPKFKCSI